MLYPESRWVAEEKRKPTREEQERDDRQYIRGVGESGGAMGAPPVAEQKRGPAKPALWGEEKPRHR